jgi:hypothetical protein
MSNFCPHQHHQSIHNIHDRCMDRGSSPRDERDAMVEEELLSEHHKQLRDSVVTDGKWEENTCQSYHLACPHS